MTESLKELRAREAKLQREMADIQVKIAERLSRTVLMCPSKDCRRGHMIKDVDFIQPYYSERELGSDNYHSHDMDPEWKCPDCGSVESLRDKPDIVELSRHFRSIVRKDTGSRY